MVSDQANELFSKLELIAIRETLLAVNRENVAPKMKLLEVIVKDTNSVPLIPVKLGFIHYGKVYVIQNINKYSYDKPIPL